MSFYTEFSTFYERIFPFRDEVYQFLNSYLPANETDCLILDVGCGTGHYTGKFAEQGLSTYGIDLDKGMIESAKACYPNAQFCNLNMVDINSLNKRFDLIFCIGNVLAHLNKNELTQFLDAVKGCLKPGGIWIFQVLNWELITQQEHYQFPPKEFPDDNLSFQREYDINSTDELSFKTKLIRDGDVLFDDSVNLYPIISEDYLQLHSQAGFKLTGHFQDYQKTTYDETIDCANIFVFNVPL